MAFTSISVQNDWLKKINQTFGCNWSFFLFANRLNIHLWFAPECLPCSLQMAGCVSLHSISTPFANDVGLFSQVLWLKLILQIKYNLFSNIQRQVGQFNNNANLFRNVKNVVQADEANSICFSKYNCAVSWSCKSNPFTKIQTNVL